MLLPVRSSALLFSLLALSGGCGPTPPAAASAPLLPLPAPPTAVAMPTAAAPAAGKDLPPDTEIVQLIDQCVLTKGGRVLCWGQFAFPGEQPGKVTYAPRPIEGLPPVRRIGWLESNLVIVTADGRTLRLPSRADSVNAVQPVAIPAPEEFASSTARLPDGRVWEFSSTVPHQVDVPPIRKLFPPFNCGAAEDGNAYCWGNAEFVKRVVGTGEGERRVRLSLPRGRITSGVGFWEGGGGSSRLHTCAVYEDHTVRCTHPPTQAVLAKWGEIRQLAQLGGTLCAVLANGKVRCHVTKEAARPADQDRLTWHDSELFGPALDKLEGVEELAGWIGHMCARYGGKVACWGEHQKVGDGEDPVLSAPVLVKGLPHLVSLDAVANAKDHCGLDAEGRAHCFRSDARVPGPFELPLPEPAARFVGSSGYGCMKGSKSGKWYCRSVGFIRGTAPTDFAPLLDPGGRPIVDLTAIGLRMVSSINVALPDQTWGTFAVHIGEQPLRLTSRGKLPAAPKGERALLGQCFAGSDGTLYYDMGKTWGTKKGFARIVTMAGCAFQSSNTGADCGLDEAGAVWCSSRGGEPRREAEGVADLSHDCYVTKAGAAYCLGSNGELPFTKVEGLPEVARAVEKCALSKGGEVYCWGDRYNAGSLGTFRAEPKELKFSEVKR